MSAGDHLSPAQFGPAFDPAHADYSGTAYAYKAGVNQRSAGTATMLGQFHAADVGLGIPTGSTTDFRPPSFSQTTSFTPNTQSYEN